MTHVMWVDADDDHVLINTEAHHAKAKAMDADPRVALAIWDATSAYRYGEIRGTVVERITGPRPAPTSASWRANTRVPTTRTRSQSDRVIYKIAPARQHMRG